MSKQKKLSESDELEQLSVVRTHLELAVAAFIEHGPTYRNVRRTLRGIGLRMAYLEGGANGALTFAQNWIDDEENM